MEISLASPLFRGIQRVSKRNPSGKVSREALQICNLRIGNVIGRMNRYKCAETQPIHGFRARTI